MIWNHWYAACASSRLGAAPRMVRVLDRDLVLWRDATGTARALLDRCCHRGYRLSLGSVVDGHLVCGLHGWRYDTSGRCQEIPSLCAGARVPDGFCVPAFDCMEIDGYIWIWMGQAGARPRTTPAIPGFARHSWLQGCVEMRCSAARGIEINLDGAHIYFVHPNHPATVAWRTSPDILRDGQQEMRITERGLVVFWPPAGSAEPIPDSASRIAFELPNALRFANPYDARILVMFFVPTGETSCRLEYLMSREPGGPPVVWIDRVPEIFGQDRDVLEVVRANADREARSEPSVEADTVALVARRILRLAEAGRWDKGLSAMEPQRRIVETRRIDAPPLIER